MKEPMIVINYKVYESSFGIAALNIAKAAERVSTDLGVSIVIAPPATEIRWLAKEVSIPIYAQHADSVELGAYTGHIPLEVIKDAGASGFIANHSEKRIRIDEIVKLINKAKAFNIKSLICADTPEVAAAISITNPDIIAIEPPELIGTGIAVSRAKPEIILNTVAKVRSVNKDVMILTGAGISSAEDVAKAIELGTSGVLVSSAVMKSRQPDKIILEMATAALKAFRK